MDSHLRVPTPVFLSNWSFLDVCYVSCAAARTLSESSQSREPSPSVGWAARHFVFCRPGLAACFLLTVMALDRGAAICSPLPYTVLMSHALCSKKAAEPTWVGSSVL